LARWGKTAKALRSSLRNSKPSGGGYLLADEKAIFIKGKEQCSAFHYGHPL
jgi:hypothetical protein